MALSLCTRLLLFELDDAKRYLSESMSRASFGGRLDEAERRATQFLGSGPRRSDSGSLTSVQQRLVKTGGRLVKHARYYWLLLAEGYLTRRLFGAMLQRIWALPVPT
jgi:hypothetical protein